MKRIYRRAPLPQVFQEGLLVLILIIISAVLAGCSNIYGVTHNYDGDINFAQLETYDWAPVIMQTEADSTTIKRIQRSVNKNMQAKGYRQSSISPDFTIVTVFGNQQRLAEAPDPYMAAYSPYTAPPARHYKECSLVQDLVDADDKYLLWRGSASADLSGIKTPEQIEKTIDAAIEKVMKNFPPE